MIMECTYRIFIHYCSSISAENQESETTRKKRNLVLSEGEDDAEGGLSDNEGIMICQMLFSTPLQILSVFDYREGGT